MYIKHSICHDLGGKIYTMVTNFNGKKCNLTLAMSPTCDSNSPLPIHLPNALSHARGAESPVMRLVMYYNVVKFRIPNYNTFRDMNYCPVGQTDRRTESDAYEPTVQSAQVGSKRGEFAYMGHDI